MEILENYYNLDNSYKKSYLKNNSVLNDNDESIENLFYNITSDVDIVLSILKIPSSKSGFQYWKDAVFIYILNEKSKLSICNEIYPVIAKKYSKTAMAVERAMRLCLENALFNISKCESNFISDYMYNYLIIPHNSEILCRIVELVVSKEFQREKLNLRFKNNQR